jgi:hypothetical protein
MSFGLRLGCSVDRYDQRMSATAAQPAQPPVLSPSAKFVRRWAAIVSWVAAGVLLLITGIWASDLMEGAISTALAIFSAGIFMATIQSPGKFWAGFIIIVGGLAAAFFATLGTVPIILTIVNAVVTVVSVCLTTFGPNQRTHLS